MSSATASAGGIAADREVEQILDSFRVLPTIPEVLVRIWQLVEDPQSSARELQQVVSLDPALASRLLRLANSPYYGSKSTIQDVRGAINVLGFDVIRELAVCLAVTRQLVENEATDDSMDRRALWRHCVATAVVSRETSLALAVGSAEECFTGGLLHDIGKYVISLGRPGAYAAVTARAAQQHEGILSAEREVLGYDHASIGAAFARRWNFPAPIRETIRCHHDTGVASRPGSVDVVAFANGFTDALHDYRAGGGERGSGPHPQHLLNLGVNSTWVEDQSARWARKIGEAQELLSLI